MAEDLDLQSLIDRGVALGARLEPGAVVWLEGELGAGKTTFVQAVARGLGVVEMPTSPTYSLVHRYEGKRGPIYHVDCYRLKTPDEARELDWDTLVTGDALLVEWPARGGAWVPTASHHVRLDHLADADRRRLALR